MRVLSRIALIALVIGTSMTVSATERITVGLVLAGFACWSFVPVLQLLTGILLIAGIPGERWHLLDRYFATHWPWSLWILAVHSLLLTVPGVRAFSLILAVTAAAPVLWTCRLLIAFCRTELNLDRRRSLRRVGMHQLVTYLMLIAYVSFAIALWPRILSLFA